MNRYNFYKDKLRTMTKTHLYKTNNRHGKVRL